MRAISANRAHVQRDDPLANLPPEEQALRRELGEAMMTFVQEILTTSQPGSPEAPGKPVPLEHDVPMREYYTEKFRQAVETAAAHGIEVSLCWHTLAVWTNDGAQRVGYFARALECVESDRDAHLRP
jgi:hypothetical protein